MTLPARRGRNWASKRRSGRWPMRCAPGSSATGCRWRCTWMGRTCTSARPRRKERLRGEEPITQFGRMCVKLGIAVIAANSPQAKGRVERQHGTHQDRLVKKMRRKQITSHAQANVYLETEYLPEHNRRFARAAARPEDYHRRAPSAAALHRIFRLETERTISNDWVVRYQSRFFQLQPQSRRYAPAQGKVVICEGRHGSIAIEYRGRELRWEEISPPARPSGQTATARDAKQGGGVSAVKRRGCRQRITRGERPPAEGWRGEKGERRARPRSRRRRWPCPPLRPKRSALWAPQGYAPGKANDPDKSRTRKGDTFNEVRKGTFLTSFDSVDNP